MGQQQPTTQPHSARTYHYQSTTPIPTPTHKSKSTLTGPLTAPLTPLPEHEGMLKLRSTPFPGCVEISNDGNLLFLENAQATLSDLLDNRLYTNRLFPIQDVERLIENVVYTLAFLAENKYIYKDLCGENIYYSHGLFKLLPNELIQHQLYEKAWQSFHGPQTQTPNPSTTTTPKKPPLHPEPPQSPQPDSTLPLPYLSPQLIIALRMKQKSITDDQLLHKTNVFALGMILLEVTTLLPSSQCYDVESYDIFNNVVSDRLELVEENYSEGIARVVGNMLDYDFGERMDLRELAIWVNRELATSRRQSIHRYQQPYSQQKDPKTSQIPSKSSITIHKSRINPATEQQKPSTQQMEAQQNSLTLQPERYQQRFQQRRPVQTKCYTKTNIVYINGYDQAAKDQPRYSESYRGAKNCVYLEGLPQLEVDYYANRNIDDRYLHQPVQMRKQTNNLGPTIASDYRNGYNNAYLNNPPKYKYQYQRQANYSRTIPQDPYEQNMGYSRGYTKSSQIQNNQKAEYVNYAPPVATTSALPSSSAYLKDIGNLRAQNKISQESPSQYKRKYEYNLEEPGVTEKPRYDNSSNINISSNKYYPSLSNIDLESKPKYQQNIPHNRDRDRDTTKRIQPQPQPQSNSLPPPSQIRTSQARQTYESKQSKQSDSKCSVNDGSINRIKMEIEKSRKLIEEFKRCQGICEE